MDNNQMGFAPVTASTAGAPMTETEMGGAPTEQGGYDYDDEDDWSDSDWDKYNPRLGAFGVFMIIIFVGGAIFAIIYVAFPELFIKKSVEEEVDSENEEES
jgi:hypothetical protein